MAKKIRGVKLKEENIQKNSGKNISHTISKIKAHERYYTTLLVMVFMVVITGALYFGLKVNAYEYDIEKIDKSSGFSYTSRLVYLNSNRNDSTYTVTLSNMTNNIVNYLIRIEPDEDSIKQCNCEDKIVPFDKIKYSLEDRIERTFTSNEMIITTGYIHPLESEDIPVKIWLSDDNNDDQEKFFYGRIIIDKIGS